MFVGSYYSPIYKKYRETTNIVILAVEGRFLSVLTVPGAAWPKLVHGRGPGEKSALHRGPA